MAPAIATDIIPIKGCCVYPWHLLYPLWLSSLWLCGKEGGQLPMISFYGLWFHASFREHFICSARRNDYRAWGGVGAWHLLLLCCCCCPRHVRHLKRFWLAAYQALSSLANSLRVLFLFRFAYFAFCVLRFFAPCAFFFSLVFVYFVRFFMSFSRSFFFFLFLHNKTLCIFAQFRKYLCFLCCCCSSALCSSSSSLSSSSCYCCSCWFLYLLTVELGVGEGEPRYDLWVG